jgi:hypothetical protein
LSPARDARADVVAAALFLRVEREVFDEEGAGADEAHVSFEDVDDLGQFIDRRGADESADGGESVFVGQELALGVSAVIHRLELDHLEEASMEAGAFLGEEDGATVGHEQQEHRGEDDG